MTATWRCVPIALLAAAWVLLRALHAASTVGLLVERALAVLLVGALALAVVAEARRVAWPAVRDALAARGRSAWWFAALAGVLFVAHAGLAGVLRVVPVDLAHAGAASVHLMHGFGPLTVWPALAVWLPGPSVAAFLTLGRAILLAASAVLAAGALVLAARRGATRRCRTLAGAAAASPAITAACAACAPVLVALLGPGVMPLARLVENPASPLVAALDAASLLVGLGAVAALAPAPPQRPRVPVWPERVVPAAAVTLPLLVAGLMRVTPAVAWFGDAPSEAQEMIARLFRWATVGAIALTLAALVPLVWFAVKYRYREDVTPPSHELGPRSRRVFRVAVVAVPAAVLFALAIMSHDVLVALEEPPEGTLHVDVTGMQFGWRFTYPDGSTALNELRVPEGEVVVLHVASVDVVHSFFVPDLGVKVDANPGMVNDYWFRATRAGTYQAHCAEFCGVGHAGMLATVTVEPAGGERDG